MKRQSFGVIKYILNYLLFMFFFCFLIESDKFREIAAATESPPKGTFQFSDEQEYPPLTQNSD